ncbi:hypothetical protein HanRHA438_Chr05g0232561 [Helianthus annuus]|uniref:Uncharacterized protein n=1 Tax=Helianthus annuus TaxID=4232 RepID=A0A251URJ7_HELAN|nr:hypothetical protein HanXRQr2_Chr05g0223481 [Helianthus annuus]KAJ0585210.1 hypothetical protein HanHA89_Chr05g0197651 [Helianthus annuus]KAJ0919695.1 hypothetical protein HanRHA438_Chr05g0232561 [Helianthus annuus]KAJ0923433.1 hypothetical protein HanPSC8_Chr05g0215821 [Helianthus annuus]
MLGPTTFTSRVRFYRVSVSGQVLLRFSFRSDPNREFSFLFTRASGERHRFRFTFEFVSDNHSRAFVHWIIHLYSCVITTNRNAINVVRQDDEEIKLGWT